MNIVSHYSSFAFHPHLQENKKRETGLRIVRKEQVGQNLITWKKTSQGLMKTAENIITQDCVIARDCQVIGYDGEKPIYHEWLMSKEAVAQIFGHHVVKQLNLNVAYYFERSIVG